MNPVDDLAMQAAVSRTKLHASHRSQRQLSDGYDHVGMAGELAFGKAFGLMPDFDSLASGDKGVDFVLPLALTVDVKTFRKPRNLVHEVGKPFADLYVLAQYNDEDGSSRLLGWATGWDLAQAPTMTLPGHSVLNHCIPASELRPMEHLLKKRLVGMPLVKREKT